MINGDCGLLSSSLPTSSFSSCRDVEIDELRGQLVRMQEDWIEEECHRVEAQMALKEARKEIRQLQHVVENVHPNLGPGREPSPGVSSEPLQTPTPTHSHPHAEPKSEGWYGGGMRMGARPGLSRSCGCSPAHTLSRSATYTRLSTESPLSDRNGNIAGGLESRAAAGGGGGGGGGGGMGAMKSKTLPRGDGHSTRLLLEAAMLTEQLPRCPSMARSSTYERLYSGETMMPSCMPLSVPVAHVPHAPCCHHAALNNNCTCGTPHTYMPHHHLFLHLPQEEAPPPPTIPPPPPPPSAPTQSTAWSTAASPHQQHPPRLVSSAPSECSEVSDRPGFRSQACSPTITWISEEGTGEELSLITAGSVSASASVSCMIPSTSSANIATSTTSTNTSAMETDTSLLLSEATPFFSLASPMPSSSSVTPQPTCVDMAQPSPLDDLGSGGPSSSLELFPPTPASASRLPTPQTQQPRASPSPSPLAELPPPPTPPPLAPPSPQEMLVLEVSEEESDDVRSPLSAGVNRDEDEEDDGGQEPLQRCHWSRYFLVDFLAVAVPVVPAVAWLCRGARRPDVPMYPIGSLLRGCCAVALHSLRRVGRGRGRGRGPANTGGATNI